MWTSAAHAAVLEVWVGNPTWIAKNHEVEVYFSFSVVDFKNCQIATRWFGLTEKVDFLKQKVNFTHFFRDSTWNAKSRRDLFTHGEMISPFYTQPERLSAFCFDALEYVRLCLRASSCGWPSNRQLGTVSPRGSEGHPLSSRLVFNFQYSLSVSLFGGTYCNHAALGDSLRCGMCALLHSKCAWIPLSSMFYALIRRLYYFRGKNAIFKVHWNPIQKRQKLKLN